MPVIFQLHIARDDIRRNPDVLYVFGDNVQRKGTGGQAREMRGEPNSAGVATKYTPAHGDGAYFSDDDRDYKSQCRIVDTDMKRLFDQVLRGGIVVWPTSGIGTGIADLKVKAPRTLIYIERKLAALVRCGKLFERGEIERAQAQAAMTVKEASEI